MTALRPCIFSFNHYTVSLRLHSWNTHVMVNLYAEKCIERDVKLSHCCSVQNKPMCCTVQVHIAHKRSNCTNCSSVQTLWSKWPSASNMAIVNWLHSLLLFLLGLQNQHINCKTPAHPYLNLILSDDSISTSSEESFTMATEWINGVAVWSSELQ